MNRRALLSSIGGVALATSLAGCTGTSTTSVTETEVVVDDPINLSKIELDIRSQESGEMSSTESSITIYPEDQVVCYGEGDGSSEHTGCVRSSALTDKYMDVYRREQSEEGE